MSKRIWEVANDLAGLRPRHASSGGNLFQAELAAREMGTLPLGYALALCRLLADTGDGRFERAAVRWHGRFVVERGVETLPENLQAETRQSRCSTGWRSAGACPDRPSALALPHL